jgi:membrane protease YdiL (CAAX protease family)
MTVIEDDLPKLPINAGHLGVRTESAWRLIAVAIGWILLAEAAAGVFGFFIGFFRSVLHLQTGLVFELLTRSTYSFAAASVILVATIVRGRIIGTGDVHAGLGNNPPSRLPILLVLAILIAGYAGLIEYSFIVGRPDLANRYASISIYLQLPQFLITVFLAPVAEELFFRGWLWNGLRQRWNALSTASLTAIFWLLLHLEQGLFTPIALIPAALVLTLARHLSNSVRAPIFLHIIYNLIVAGMPLGMSMLAYVPSPTKIEPPVISLSRAALSGNEVQIAAMNVVEADCSPGPVPDVRVAMPPKSGGLRLSQISMAVDRRKEDARAHCNGKFVQAMGVYYKSASAFVGNDKVLLDVDFRDGSVRRYAIGINVR